MLKPLTWKDLFEAKLKGLIEAFVMISAHSDLKGSGHQKSFFLSVLFALRLMWPPVCGKVIDVRRLENAARSSQYANVME